MYLFGSGALIGTPYLPDLTDHVLIIEEVSEPMYNIDRLLFHMGHATQLKGVAGVHVMAYRQEELVAEIIEESGLLPRRWRSELGQNNPCEEVMV